MVDEQRYYPFGETRLSTGSIFTDQLFTGQREMTGLGIYHFNARFYSPKLGRFLSADSIVPNPANPQDLNRFAYVRNNPLRYIDPTGNRPCGDGEKYDCDGKLNPTTPSKPTVVIVPNPKPDKTDPNPNNVGVPIDISTPFNPIDIYCGDISGLACAANVTQDIATIIGVVGVVFIEAPAVADGCLAGGPFGCVVAEVGVIVVWNLTLNNAETVASTASLLLTGADDLINNGGFGENTATSLATWGGLDPSHSFLGSCS